MMGHSRYMPGPAFGKHKKTVKLIIWSQNLIASVGLQPWVWSKPAPNRRFYFINLF